MAVPKKRTGKSRKNIRRKDHKIAAAHLVRCKKCGEFTKPHMVCVSCGNYNK